MRARAVTVPGQALERLDDALFDLRRIWERPELRRRFLSLWGEPVEQGVFRTLRAIELAEVTEPCVGDVAVTLKVDPSTASRLVEAVVGAGYVHRTSPREDRRRSTLELSAAGKQLMRRATRVRRQILADALASWNEEDLTALGGLLARLNRELLSLEERDL